MAYDDITVVKKPKPEVLAISAILAIGGVGMILLAVRGKKEGYGEPKTFRGSEPGELMSLPVSPTLDGTGVITVPIGRVIPVLDPTVLYIGPGRDTFSYFQVKQRQHGQDVTVYASGVAGVHVGPATEATIFNLVSSDQPQPQGCPQPSLCAMNYDDPRLPVGWICGAPPMPGYGDAYLQIYHNQDAQDGDGFASPTCGSATVQIPRVPIISKVYRGKVRFT